MLFINHHYYAQQKVGLVLSGGGAAGLAHVGVLKALEENNIPIDYITGTSAGALVGSLYAAGYSPEEIEAYLLSDKFQMMLKGEIKANQHFLMREPDPNAGLIGISVSQDSLLKKSLPTNFRSSALLDYEMMKILGPASASNHNNFDSLFVPFRCVAADIAQKRSIIYQDGSLNAAVRASMSYPFYFKPIRIDNILLFDGGLYNNFPADVMYENFSPDYIIGSNVTYNADLPDEDDIISQLTNMLVAYSDFSLPCEEGYVIEPQSDIGTFEFSEAQKAIDEGYAATILIMDSLKLNITGRRSQEELVRRRMQFRSNIVPLVVSSVSVNSNKRKMIFSGRSIIKRKKLERLDEKLLEKRYFRLYAMSQVEFIYPTISLIDDSTYAIELNMNKAREIRLDVGGHFSSRPVNTGYIGLSYQSIGRVITKTHVESYFGKFYGSGKAKFTMEFPRVYPISTSAYFVLNRWDYFRSFATFFEDVKPSFLIQNEMYAGVQFDHPLGNTIKSTIDARWYEIEDQYYQTEDFTNEDTVDVTTLDGFSTSWTLTQNSLNRQQFSSGGHYVRFKIRYVYGQEHTISGSTAPLPFDYTKYHSWINMSLDYQSFVVDKPVFHLGLHGQAVYNSQSLFSNYTATLLAMNEFSLVPDARTYFLPEYRSPQSLAGGINLIFTIKKKVDIRVDGYIYQPIIQISENDDGTQSFSEPFKGGTYMASSSVIYHSFIGPIRLTANYFPKQENPFAFQLSWGYVLFNDRAIR